MAKEVKLIHSCVSCLYVSHPKSRRKYEVATAQNEAYFGAKVRGVGAVSRLLTLAIDGGDWSGLPPGKQPPSPVVYNPTWFSETV